MGAPAEGGRGASPGAVMARKITEEERALLEHAMHSVRPLKGRRPKTSAKGPTKTAPAKMPVPAKPAEKPHRTTPARKLPASLKAIDRRTDQKLRQGKIEIDATLDLHGLSQARAHARLASFLARAAADGARTVLVITGKGMPSSGFGEAPDRRRGVLRDAVPRWLEEAPLRDLVWGIRAAGPRQGGDGALYVLLRKSR